MYKVNVENYMYRENFGIKGKIRDRLCSEFTTIPDFKSYKKITSARVYFMKTVKDCNDGQCRHTSLLCLYLEIFLFYREQPYAIKT